MKATEHVPCTLTLGIDIASQPSNTGVCLVEWKAGSGRVIELGPDAGTDANLLKLMADPAVSTTGIDAPLGWPTLLVEALAGLQEGRPWPVGKEPRELLYRRTDRHVAGQMGRPPLSVAASYLAWPALRAVDLRQQAIDGRGDRAPTILEVYPAAAFTRWGMISNGISYRGADAPQTERRRVMIDALAEGLGPSFSVSPEIRQGCIESDHLVDALACALVARAAECRDGIDPVPDGHEVAARQEGWIRLPSSDVLARLCGG